MDKQKLKKKSIQSFPVTFEVNKRKTGAKKGRIAFITILSILMVFSGSLLYVWSRLRAVNLDYEIPRQIQLQRKLMQLNTRLRLEAATLKSHERIESIAKGDLGMVVPKRGQTVVIYNGN